MVIDQLERRGIRDRRVLDVMERIPRHEFVPGLARRRAYEDEPQRIGVGQTISQPYIVAAMAEALALRGHERVLEVGAGSGYAAAVLASLASAVYAIELEEALAGTARENLERAGCGDRVTIICGDGTLGDPEEAPYQAISVAAAAPDIPPALIEQLDSEGARLVLPVGSARDQELRLIRKQGEKLETSVVTGCRFVPLRGAGGWGN